LTAQERVQSYPMVGAWRRGKFFVWIVAVACALLVVVFTDNSLVEMASRNACRTLARGGGGASVDVEAVARICAPAAEDW
jgi:hypothetical protein